MPQAHRHSSLTCWQNKGDLWATCIPLGFNITLALQKQKNEMTKSLYHCFEKLVSTLITQILFNNNLVVLRLHDIFSSKSKCQRMYTNYFLSERKNFRSHPCLKILAEVFLSRFHQAIDLKDIWIQGWQVLLKKGKLEISGTLVLVMVYGISVNYGDIDKSYRNVSDVSKKKNKYPTEPLLAHMASSRRF